MPEERNQFDTGLSKTEDFQNSGHFTLVNSVWFALKKKKKKLSPFIASLNLKQLLH